MPVSPHSLSVPDEALRLYHLHMDLARDLGIQLRLDDICAKGLDRLVEHDLVLGDLDAVLGLERLGDLLGGHGAEQAAAGAALGADLNLQALELFRDVAGVLLFERDTAGLGLIGLAL